VGSMSWICEVLTWLARPCVIPWAGAAAAILGALTVEPKTWLKSPMKSLGRALRVAAVWLLIAWMLSCAAQLGSAQGDGEGGANGAGTSNGTTPMPPPVAVVRSPSPSGTPEHVDLVVSFVPSPGNPTAAQDFSCDIFQKGTGKKTEIRARDMHDFDKLLGQLLHFILREAPKQTTVLIKRSPFPGENAVRRVGDKVRAVLPSATVVFDEGSAP
jgi:hypothetical protein